VSQRFLGAELVKIGFIPFDPTVSQAIKEQQPLIIKYAQSTAAHHIKQIARNLITKDTVHPTGTRSFFEHLAGKFR
jgi:MinD-like ATPase involved in chromosome partitioning or flagellar assembly